VRQSPAGVLVVRQPRTSFFRSRIKQYLANEMRTAFGYEGCPITVCAESASENRRISEETQAVVEQKSGGPDGRVSGGAARKIIRKPKKKDALKLSQRR